MIVLVKSWKTCHSLVVPQKLRVVLVNTSLSNEIHEFEQFEPVEVHVSHVVSNYVLVVANELEQWLDVSFDFGSNLNSLLASVAWHSNCPFESGKGTIEHLNSSLVTWSLAQQFRLVLPSNVLMNSVGLSQEYVTVYDVRQVWER